MSQPLINKGYHCVVYGTAGAVLITCVAAVGPWEATKIIGQTILCGAFCATVHGTNACIKYPKFFYIHPVVLPKGPLPLNTKQPILHGLFFGGYNGSQIGSVYGTMFALLSRMPLPYATHQLNASDLSPFFITGVALVLSMPYFLNGLLENKIDRDPLAHNIFRSRVSHFIAFSGSCITSVAIVAMRYDLI